MASRLCLNNLLWKTGKKKKGVLLFSCCWRNLATKSYPRLEIKPVGGHDYGDPDATMVDYRFLSVEEDNMATLVKKSPKWLQNAHCVAGSFPGGWQAYIKDDDLELYLANKLSNSNSNSVDIIPLPTIHTLPSVNRKVMTESLSNPSIESIVFHGPKIWPERTHEDIINDRLLIDRMALSSAPNQNQKCDVMVIHGPTGKLAFCRLGVRDDFSSSSLSWSPLITLDCAGFYDVIYSEKKKLFYALDYKGNFYAWDLRNPTIPPVTVFQEAKNNNIVYDIPKLSRSQEDLKSRADTLQFLTESTSGDMLRIVCHLFKVPIFEVYKIDFEGGRGRYMEDLGDDVLFLDSGRSFAVSTYEFPKLKPNSIYSCLKSAPYLLDDFKCSIYNLKNQSAEPLSSRYLKDNHPFTWVAPIP